MEDREGHPFVGPSGPDFGQGSRRGANPAAGGLNH
jgi:uracil-DNA glycosylase